MVGPAVEIAERVGASCASNGGGSFYVCEGKTVEFIGCCTIDPCKTSNGNCPLESLRNTTYRATSHDLILPQHCASSDANDQWWTCSGVKPVPFMGCCGVNACQNNGCPADKLTSAILNPDYEKSKIFRTEDSSGGKKLSTGAIVGIAIGAVAGAIIIFGLLFWLWKRRQAQQNTQQEQTRGPVNPNEMSFHGHGHPSVMESPHNKLVSPYTSTYTPSVANTQYDYMHQPSSPSPQMSTAQWNENMYSHGQQRGYVPSMVSNGDDGWKPPQQYMAQELPSEHIVVELPEDTAAAPVRHGDGKP